MTIKSTTSDLRFDPYDSGVAFNPYPLFRRLREESPLYYNEEHDFYALSRYEDVEHAYANRQTYISGRGAVLDQIKSDQAIPPGTLICDDPPVHTIYRSLMSRMFTPKRVSELEPQIRRVCANILDPLVGSGHFDFINDLGVWLPLRVISMLIGIPEEDEERIHGRFEAIMRQHNMEEVFRGDLFADYIDWRVDHPSDDILTQLMRVEFQDETGTVRRLTREELLAYVNQLALAGAHTTTILIGWTGKLLADYPDQRRMLVDDPTLIPSAIEEILRFETPVLQNARYVVRDCEHYGRRVPEGSAVLLLIGSANRDDRRYNDPDQFDVHRPAGHHFSFGFAAHYCLGQALARMEGRIALDEVLKRFPEWSVDWDNAKFVPFGTANELRGWGALPALTS